MIIMMQQNINITHPTVYIYKCYDNCVNMEIQLVCVIIKYQKVLVVILLLCGVYSCG